MTSHASSLILLSIELVIYWHLLKGWSIFLTIILTLFEHGLRVYRVVFSIESKLPQVLCATVLV